MHFHRSQLILDPRPAIARAARWVLTPADSLCLAPLCLVGLSLVGRWLFVQSQLTGLVQLEHSCPQPVPFRLDMNEADWPALAQLPGIGQHAGPAHRRVEASGRSVSSAWTTCSVSPVLDRKRSPAGGIPSRVNRDCCGRGGSPVSFKLHSPFQPRGDQPAAIEALVAGLQTAAGDQVLMGVTGSGKTFTMANVIAGRCSVRRW